MRTSLFTLLCLAAVPASAHANKKPMNLTVTSTAFSANETIPAEYTCDGAENTPTLTWSEVPKNTKSVALLVEDPDAPKGTFTHWLVTNIEPTVTTIGPGTSIPEGAVAAKNDKGKEGYAGPCPPSGTHHYHFRVFALDKMIAPPTSRAAFLKEIKDHVLAEGELVATYTKQTR
jgi:Raf kinase inhibitor-like YbhB/YbcL family protein